MYNQLFFLKLLLKRVTIRLILKNQTNIEIFWQTTKGYNKLRKYLYAPIDLQLFWLNNKTLRSINPTENAYYLILTNIKKYIHAKCKFFIWYKYSIHIILYYYIAHGWRKDI